MNRTAFCVVSLLLSFLTLGVVRNTVTSPGGVPTTVTPANLETEGAQVNRAALVGYLNDSRSNASPFGGGFSFAEVNSLVSGAGGQFTYTGPMIANGLITRTGVSGATTDTTDTATNIINAIPGAKLNQTFPLLIANLLTGTLTLAAGTGVTLLGTTTLATVTAKLFLGQVTGLGTAAAVNISEVFGIGATVSY
jgi:hypothetical protein